MRGRKPKPTATKLREGNAGKRVLSNDVMPPREFVIEAPDYLDATGVAEWQRLIGELDRMGVYTSWDRQALGAYCQAYQEWIKAQRRLKKEGHYITTKNGLKQISPVLSVMRQNRADMIKFGGLLGLNPAERARLKQGEKGGLDGYGADADFGEGVM